MVDMITIKRHPFVAVFAAFVAVVLILVFVFFENLLVFVGSVVLEQEEPRRASYIVVLQGSIPDRVVYGVELYEEGYADTILMVESHSFSNYELLEKHDLDIPSNVQINKQVALQMGVNEDDVKILPGKVDSTRQEAKAVGEYLYEGQLDQANQEAAGREGEPGKEERTLEILLVTSEFHSNRAKLIFQQELSRKNQEEAEIISTPSPYDPFCPDEWWHDRRQMRNLFMEYLKLINFYTFGI